MEAVAAQTRELLGYSPLFINRADLDDPFQRPDQWEAAGKLMHHHGWRVRLIIARIPGPRPGVPCYNLGHLSELEAMSRTGKATTDRLGGGRYAWGAVEQSPAGEVYVGLDSDGEPTFKPCGTGPHVMAVIGPDHDIPEDMDIIWNVVTEDRAEVAHTMRYGMKGYNSEANSELHDFKAGSFTPPCPLKLALHVLDREAVREELRREKAAGKRKSASFPAMRFTLHAPRPKARKHPPIRYVEVSEEPSVPLPPTADRREAARSAAEGRDNPSPVKEQRRAVLNLHHDHRQTLRPIPAQADSLHAQALTLERDRAQGVQGIHDHGGAQRAA